MGIWGPKSHALLLYYQPTPSDLGWIWGGSGEDLGPIWKAFLHLEQLCVDEMRLLLIFVDSWEIAFPVSFAMSNALWADS